MTSDPLITRVRGEYGEMPGLRLTLAQACRLWQMEARACEAILETLVAQGFLARTADGAFIATPTTSRGSKARLIATPERKPA